MTPPKTFDEVTPALAKIAAEGKNYLPLAMTGQPSNQGDWTAWPWMSGYGFSYDNLDQSAVEQAFTLAADWSNSAGDRRSRDRRPRRRRVPVFRR